MSKKAAIVVFQKKPEAGKVKTRLAATIGDKKAMEVYEYLLDLTHRQLARMDIPVFVFFETVLDRGYQRVIIIGTDCPGLEAEDMEAAISALESHDLVIGPAYDGGYYLLGMKKLYEPLFENKNWSSSTVFSDTMADVNAL